MAVNQVTSLMGSKDGAAIPAALEGVPMSWDAVSTPPATRSDLLLASAQDQQCMSIEGYDMQLLATTGDIDTRS